MKLVINTEKLFRCTCCNTTFIADGTEYWKESIPMEPNCYSWCPTCGGQVWDSGLDLTAVPVHDWGGAAK